jgi:FdhE protein
MDAAQQRWIEQNPFLEPLARFQDTIATAAAGLDVAAPDLPPFAAHAGPFRAGVALLRGQSHGPHFAAAGGAALARLAGRTAAQALPQAIAAGVVEVTGALATPEGRAAAMAWLLGGGPDEAAPVQAGLLRFLGWTALGRLVAPMAKPWADWRATEPWNRPTCPTCGQLPVMSQLVGREAGRDRVLVCGCCATRWGYKRVGCPYCGNDAADRMALLELQGSTGLRLDVCESCKGYVKTYAGQGQEALYLADWPTLLLDAMASERGYARRGVSLFDL